MSKEISYHNKSAEAKIQKIHFTDSTQGDHFVFFEGHEFANRSKLLHTVQTTLPDLEIISHTTVNGQNIIIGRTPHQPKDLVDKVQTLTDEKFKPFIKKEVKKVDLNKLRGNIGVLAQFLMIGSAFYDGDKLEKIAKEGATNYYKTDDGKAKLKTSFYGFLGNGINSIWGAQKELDETRLLYAKELVNKGISLRNDENKSTLPRPEDTKRLEKSVDDPTFMQRNSIRVGSAVKLWSKVELTGAKDDGLKLSGWLSIIGKTISLLGLPEDKFNLEKKQGPLTRLRRESNIVSTFFDWTSTFSLFASSFRRDKNLTDEQKDEVKANRKWYSLFDFKNTEWRKGDNIQWWQLSGAMAFGLSLLTKAFSPYTEKKLDIENLKSHASLAIASSVKADSLEELVYATSQMMQTRELPELHDQGFARTFTDIANLLEKHHSVNLHLNASKPIAINQQEPQQTDLKIAPPNKNLESILAKKPESSLAMRVENAQNALDVAVSASI